MTNAELHELNAKNFIERIFAREKKDYFELMNDLIEKVEHWRSEYRELHRINLFDLSDKDFTRKNYLSALINYSETKILKFKIQKDKFNRKYSK